MLKKCFKFNFFIAHHIWIRCSTRFIFIKEISKYLIPILFFKINCIIWNADLVAYTNHIFIIFCCCAYTVFIRIIPVFHEDADHIIALLF